MLVYNNGGFEFLPPLLFRVLFFSSSSRLLFFLSFFPLFAPLGFSKNVRLEGAREERTEGEEERGAFGWVQLLLIVKRRIKKGRERGRREEAAREVTIKIRGHSCFVAEVGTRR